MALMLVLRIRASLRCISKKQKLKTLSTHSTAKCPRTISLVLVGFRVRLYFLCFFFVFGVFFVRTVMQNCPDLWLSSTPVVSSADSMRLLAWVKVQSSVEDVEKSCQQPELRMSGIPLLPSERYQSRSTWSRGRWRCRFPFKSSVFFLCQKPF